MTTEPTRCVFCGQPIHYYTGEWVHYTLPRPFHWPEPAPLPPAAVLALPPASPPATAPTVQLIAELAVARRVVEAALMLERAEAEIEAHTLARTVGPDELYEETDEWRRELLERARAYRAAHPREEP